MGSESNGISHWIYPLVMTNIANWKDPPFSSWERSTISMVNIHTLPLKMAQSK